MVDLELAVAPMHRLCKKAGADRVSEAAAKELAKALRGNRRKNRQRSSRLRNARWKKNYKI